MPAQNQTTGSTNQQVLDQSNMSLQDLSIALAPPVQTPVPADNIQPSAEPVLPQPEAPQIQEGTFNSISGDVQNARKVLDSTLNTQKTDVDARIKTLEQEQNSILATGEELTQPFREKLENAERDRLHINENFEANQKLVGELESLLNEGNELINISKGRAVSNTVLGKSVNKTIGDVLARSGVIQAVMSARSGQIAEASRMIDRSMNAITADRNDQIGFYNTLLTLNNNKLISLDKESKGIAEEKMNLAKHDLEKAEATSDYVKSLMLNPETASFMADSGVTLLDSVSDVKKKMATQSKVQEVADARNKLVEAGYDIVQAKGNDTISFNIGGKEVFARVRPGSPLDLSIKQSNAALSSTLLSNSVARINKKIKQKELDNLNNPALSSVGASDETLKAIAGLSNGQRENITDARETVDEIDRMIALVESVDDVTLLTKGTIEGREFKRLSKNVVDKLARQRTGAVVGNEEEKVFRDIVGVGLFNLLAKDDTELVDGLKFMKTKHDASLLLNDPTGEIQQFMDASLLEADDSDEINTIWGVDTSTEGTAFDASGFFN